ncbi:hypothetical protein [Clostridium sp.]|uniref:hypothetical protein n=1 Tax=Clostridium sp. TaxID=1506 RepID=UPI003D6D468A
MTLLDTEKARILNSDGNYTRVDRRGKEMINSQKVFCDTALENDINSKEKIYNMKEYWSENGFVPRVSEKFKNK